MELKKDFWPKDATIPEIDSCFHGPYSYKIYSSDLEAYSHLVWVLISACSVKVEKRVLDKFYLREGKSTIKVDDFVKSLELEEITSP